MSAYLDELRADIAQLDVSPMSAYMDELRHVARREGLEKARWIDRTIRAIRRREEALAVWELNMATEIAMLLPDGFERDEACFLIEVGLDFIKRKRGLR